MNRYPIRFALKWNMYGNRPETPFADHLKIARAADTGPFCALYRKADSVRARARRNDQVVLKLLLIAVIDKVDPGI